MTRSSGSRASKRKSRASSEGESFVPLKSLARPDMDPTQAIATIRRIYFATTPKTVEHDVAHAVELLRTLPSEDARSRAVVYMDGLAQLRREWARASKPKATSRKRPSAGR